MAEPWQEYEASYPYGNRSGSDMYRTYEREDDWLSGELPCDDTLVPDTLRRCRWVKPDDDAAVRFHDAEWGRLHIDDSYLFEMLVLELYESEPVRSGGALRHRDELRVAFAGFDCDRVAGFTAARIDDILAVPQLMGGGRKRLETIVMNAAIFAAIRNQYGTFYSYVWQMTEGRVTRHRDSYAYATSKVSRSISKDLRERGMLMVNPGNVYSFLQDVGFVDDHEPNCFLA